MKMKNKKKFYRDAKIEGLSREGRALHVADAEWEWAYVCRCTSGGGSPAEIVEYRVYAGTDVSPLLDLRSYFKRNKKEEL